MPKRRGPDKTPGARQRVARDVRSQLELLPGRRRRRARDIPSSEINDTTQYDSPSLSPQRDPTDPVLLPITIAIPSPLDASISDDVCSPVGVDLCSACPCECHGLSPCPELLDTIDFIDGHGSHHMVSYSKLVEITLICLFLSLLLSYPSAFQVPMRDRPIRHNAIWNLSRGYPQLYH